MKIDQKNIMNTNTLSIPLLGVHDASGIGPSPSDCTADNHPELVVHPRMNFRSEQNTLYCVRTPLTLHTSCHAFDCYTCCVFIVSPPLSCCPVVPTTAADVAVFDYVIDDRTPTVELPGKQCPFTSPSYRLPVYIYLLH